MSSWRVVFQMRDTDEVDQMADGAVDAYNFAAALDLDDKHGILTVLRVDELVGERWTVRQNYRQR